MKQIKNSSDDSEAQYQIVRPHASTCFPLDATNSRLVEAGAALHWLKPRSKAPVAEAWSTAPRANRSDLERASVAGANIGIRLGEPSLTPWGYLHILDLDIRKPEASEAAWGELRRLVPTVDHMPMVQSGSGDGRHFYCFSDKPLQSKKLANSRDFSMVFDQKLGRKVKKFDWEIDFFGTGKQVVIPPSIHPDTGLPYRWVRPLVPELLDLGIVPSIPESLTSLKPIETDTDDDDLFAIVRAEPIDVSDSEVDGYLKDLPENWVEDRETWLKTGAALSHQYRGSKEGFEKWCAWSRQSAKFNLRDSKNVWKSFKGKTDNPITFRSVIAAVNENRDPLSDLLGTALPAKLAKPSRLAFLNPTECEAAPSRRYVIKRLLAQGDVGCIFGAPGAGKSLLAPFLTYAVAQGREVWGQRVRAGGAFYVAAEDPHGMRGRVRALKAAYGDAMGFRLVEGVSNLALESPDLVALLEAVETQKPALVVIDTLAMAFPGLEENSAESMGNVVAVARKLAEVGTAVLLVHHDTKAEGGTPRGHSILNGALDVAVHVKRDAESGAIRAKLTKNRNGPCDLDIAFTIATEDGGADEDGDMITLPRCQELSSDPMQLKLTPSEAAAVNILKCIVLDDASGLIPESLWRDACIAEGALSDSTNKESRGRVFRRVRDSLDGQGAIVRLVPEGAAEMHVRLSEFNGLDAFDDLPGQGVQEADNYQGPADSAARQAGTGGRTTRTHLLRVSGVRPPCTSPDPLTGILG